MPAKSVIVVIEKGIIKKTYWTNVKDCINDLGLPYWTLSRLKPPIKYQDFEIYRLPLNK